MWIQGKCFKLKESWEAASWTGLVIVPGEFSDTHSLQCRLLLLSGDYGQRLVATGKLVDMRMLMIQAVARTWPQRYSQETLTCWYCRVYSIQWVCHVLPKHVDEKSRRLVSPTIMHKISIGLPERGAFSSLNNNSTIVFLRSGCS